MNATKRLLTGAAIAAGALGIGAGVFFACRQELSPGAQDGSAGAERKSGDAKYDDGNYDFYFKNGAHVRGDCDGYNSEPGGKTTIYEYWQSDIKEWEKRIKGAGITPEVYRTSKAGKYCWVRFDTSLLYGIGFENYGTKMGLIHYNEADIYTNGQIVTFPARTLSYAPARGRFNTGYNLCGPGIERASKTQEKRDTPAIVFIFFTKDGCESAEKALKAAGVSIVDKGHERVNNNTSNYYLVADISNISWFAYNQ